MARLDRLATVKEVAQLGAVLGREFAYDAAAGRGAAGRGDVAARPGAAGRGRTALPARHPPQATYLFKHALIQDAAYQSLLQEHAAAVSPAHCPGVGGAVSRDCRDPTRTAGAPLHRGGLSGAGRCLLAAGGPARGERSAHVEAIRHLTKGLEVLTTLPDTPERTQQELDLQITLGTALIATKGCGPGSRTSLQARARELCQQMGETPQLFPVLFGQCGFYAARGGVPTARACGTALSWHNVCTTLAPLSRPTGVGHTCLYLGELAPARTPTWSRGLASMTPQQHRLVPYLWARPRGCVYASGLDPVAAGLSGPGAAGSHGRSPWPKSWRIP